MHVIKWYCSYLKYRQQMGVIVKVVFRKRLFITVQPYVTGPTCKTVYLSRGLMFPYDQSTFLMTNLLSLWPIYFVSERM